MKLLPILLTATIFLVGCFGEDEDTVVGGNTTGGGSAGLVGTWSGDIEEEGEVAGTQTVVFSATGFEMDWSMDMGSGPIPFMDLKGTYTATADSITLTPTECLTVDFMALMVAIASGSTDPVPLTVNCMEPDEYGETMGEPMGASYTIVGNTLTITPEADPEYPEENETMVLQRQ